MERWIDGKNRLRSDILGGDSKPDMRPWGGRFDRETQPLRRRGQVEKGALTKPTGNLILFIPKDQIKEK